MSSLQKLALEAFNFVADQAPTGSELELLVHEGVILNSNESFELLSSVVPAMLQESLDRTKVQSAGSQYNPESF